MNTATAIKYELIRYRKIDVVIWQSPEGYGFSIPGMRPDSYPYSTADLAAKAVRKMIKDAITVAIADGTNTIDARNFKS